ncbi:MAG: short-chain fatty acyl-CoA regulator family protein [Paracoccus sp. (in: a-proteobacteria)]|nr:short-chain fatty acyl-CoA regulator family protein [Paracoccus sp. (in: a-proteobacteria)]
MTRSPYLGGQLRRMREAHGLNQAALARLLGLSASYLNQIERNQRPLTPRVLARLDRQFGAQAAALHSAGDGRLAAALRAAVVEMGVPASPAELTELADNSPALARMIVDLRRRLRDATERADMLAEQISGQHDDSLALPTAYEAVRDYFYARRNHIDELDRAAEVTGEGLPHDPASRADLLAARLAGHGIALRMDAPGDDLRRFDAAAQVLHLSARLDAGQRAFQIATQIALIEAAGIIDRLCAASNLSAADQPLLRIGLANYHAGAVILPYRRFLAAAEAGRYDIEHLARQFGVGFETTCHRLSTLQREGARGVPFFFIRVDRAGNISKRQSATDFHFSRFGGSCPLWSIYEAFSRPGDLLRQIAVMPDGRRYLWVARTVRHGGGRYGAPVKDFAVALGCDITHAGQLVYARGLDLGAPDAATPIGPGCRLCERPACPQRAFPMVGQPLADEPGRSTFAPYGRGDQSSLR